MGDARAAAARQAHRDAQEHEGQAAAARERRDRLVRALRADDPRRWTYTRLARAVGCSPELVAHIVKGERRG